MLSDAQIGIKGEDIAVGYLKKMGYKILHQNYELPMGELDIVAIKDKIMSFIEVKTSLETNRQWFSPEERVDKRKRRRLQSLAETYLMRERYDPDTRWQIDVIAVTLDSEGETLHIDHIPNTVWDWRAPNSL
jgi:putative endonuclease